MTSTSTQIINIALRLLGHLRFPGMGASTDGYADGLDRLNAMLDSWNTQRLLCYTITDQVFPFTTSKQFYSIGPSGADFIAPRPVKIESANIILSGATPPTRVPLTILTSLDWSSIAVPGISTSIPLGLYMDNQFPNANLYFWPFPTLVNQLELFTWAPLAQFADLTTAYQLPTGYYEAITENLALKLAPMFRKNLDMNLLAELKQSAMISKQHIKNINAPLYRMMSDFPCGNRGQYFNYLTGYPM